MLKLITHFLTPERFPEGSQLAVLEYWTQDDFDNNLYRLHEGTLSLSREQMHILVQRGRITPLPKALPVEEGKALMCNSHGEIIFAYKNKVPHPEDQGRQVILKLLHAV